MRAISVLQKCLRSSLGSMHVLRRHTVLQAVQAAITGRRLTLIDIGLAAHRRLGRVRQLGRRLGRSS